MVSFLAMFLTQFRRQALRCFDVIRLYALVAAARQDDDGIAPLLEVDTVAMAIIDLQFANFLSYWLTIPCIPKGWTIKARRDQCTYPFALEPYSPFPEGLGMFEFTVL